MESDGPSLTDVKLFRRQNLVHTISALGRFGNPWFHEEKKKSTQIHTMKISMPNAHNQRMERYHREDMVPIG